MSGKRLVLEVPEDLVAVSGRVDRSQRRAEERLQVVCVAAGGDGIDDLVETQVGQNIGVCGIRGLDVVIDSVEQDAAKRHGRCGRARFEFEGLQVDQDGRGLVLAYNEANSEVTVVDRQLLLYRRYSTVMWPWEDLIAEANASESGYSG